MVVKLKELENAKRGGIYCLSENVPSNPDRIFTVKIGRTIDFKKRLDNYNLCFNSGFRLICLLPLQPRTKDADRKSFSMKLEKMAGELLGKPRSYANRASRGSEWYDTTINKIHKIFYQIHKNFKDEKYTLTRPPIIKFDDDYINIFENNHVQKMNVPRYVKSSTSDKIKLSRTAKTKPVRKRNQ